MSAEVGALREVLAKQTVRVLVRAALPRAVRVTEVDVEAGRDLSSELAPRFQEFKKIAEIPRTRRGGIITNYMIYLVAKPTRSVLD